ncbi:Gtpase activating protein [Dispira parvispora]|uniref:Gtpase activating protein n=1 Tax=Dispira parvispora TaxID=1520584 RepID=A0A9W8AP92_9FUNG|nr:Gtpase activating protein [Dispira parvispora]
MASMANQEKKRMQERHEKILVAMTKEPGNTVCADCGQSGPRWASWNLGVFLCIRCSGFHRKMGTHISRVKSISLDVWTPEQIESIQTKGNTKVNAHYNPNPHLHPPPSGDREMEQYIRNKYERKLFMEAGGRSSSGLRMSQTSRQRTTSSTRVHGSSSSSRTTGDSNMARLRSMGFNDEIRNAKALRRAHGNLEQAIDMLVSEEPSPPPSATPSSAAKPSTITTTKAPAEPSPMVDLLSLNDGFTSSPSAGDTTSMLSGGSNMLASLASPPSVMSPASSGTSLGLGSFPPPATTGSAITASTPSVNPLDSSVNADPSDSMDFGQFTDASFFSQPVSSTPAPTTSAPVSSAGKLDKTSILSLYSTSNTQRAVPAASGLGAPLASPGLSSGNILGTMSTSGLNSANPWQQPAQPMSSSQTTAPLAPSLLQPTMTMGSSTASTTTNPSGLNDLTTAFSTLNTTSNSTPNPTGQNHATNFGNTAPKSNKDLFGEFSDLLR